MSEHERFGFKRPYQEQPNFKKLGHLAGSLLANLWAFEIDIKKISNPDEHQIYKSLIGELDIFLFDFFESKNIQIHVNPAKSSLSDQYPQLLVSDSSSSSYYDDDDIPSDDFAEVKDLRK